MHNHRWYLGSSPTHKADKKQCFIDIKIVYSNFEPLFNSQSVGNTVLDEKKKLNCELCLNVALLSASAFHIMQMKVEMSGTL